MKNSNYTSIEQSRNLVELGLDKCTADMCYTAMKTADGGWIFNKASDIPWKNYAANEYYIPCWSLTALMNVAKVCSRCELHLRVDKKWNIFATMDDTAYRGYDGFDTPFDAYYWLVARLLEDVQLKFPQMV